MVKPVIIHCFIKIVKNAKLPIGHPQFCVQGKVPLSGSGVGMNGQGTSGSSGLLRRLKLASSRRRDFPGVESPRQQRSQTSKL